MKLSYVNRDKDRLQIKSILDVKAICREIFKDNIQLNESMWLIAMTRNNMVNGCIKISEGSNTGTVINIHFIIGTMLLSNSKSGILVHNHPSGNMNFSRQDRILFENTKKMFELFELEMTDSCICGIVNNKLEIKSSI